MVSLRERALRLRQTAAFRKLSRYLTISALTTVMSLGLLFFFYRVVDIGSAMAANVLATAITAVPSYYFNRRWAWEKSSKSHVWKEVLPYWVIAFSSLVLSTIAVGVAAHNADRITSSHLGVTILVESANLFTYVGLWILKFFFYDKLLFTKPGVIVAEAAGGSAFVLAAELEGLDPVVQAVEAVPVGVELFADSYGGAPSRPVLSENGEPVSRSSTDELFSYGD